MKIALPYETSGNLDGAECSSAARLKYDTLRLIVILISLWIAGLYDLDTKIGFLVDFRNKTPKSYQFMKLACNLPVHLVCNIGDLEFSLTSTDELAARIKIRKKSPRNIFIFTPSLPTFLQIIISMTC